MTIFKTNLTHERLRSVLNYCPVSGVFTWISKPNKSIAAGSIAGCISKGYVLIRVDGHMYAAHRLAWLYVNGVWPEHEIDHKNRNRSDNSFKNLRPATDGENASNKSIQKNNTSGVAGVHWHSQKSKWQARIKVKRKTISLGLFSEISDASAARISAEKKYFGEFSPQTSGAL